MPWQVGIDEAGYGPNLGPLAMAAVACRVPSQKVDLWERMAPVVRRHGEKDERLLVADSKLVYMSGKGLALLEDGVLAFLCGGGQMVSERCTLLSLVTALCGQSLAEMKKEAWFHGNTMLPLASEGENLQANGDNWRDASQEAELTWGPAACVLIAAPRFNGMVERWGSKGAVLGLALVELLGHCLELPGDEALEIRVDKHGGRNNYGAVLQHAFPDGMVLARAEGALRSRYEVVGLGRKVHVTFEPRADVAAFCVALASMICKYMREALMGEFNEFFLDIVPGLAPTAGYPTDAHRFFDAILPALTKLGIARECIWRSR